MADGRYLIDGKTKVTGPESLAAEGDFLAGMLAFASGFDVKFVTGAPTDEHTIVLQLDDSIPQDDGYRLMVDAGSITLSGKTAQGVFYGIQTLRQLLPAAAESSVVPQLTLPAVQITDYPRFGYRGMMLDVCRHFFPIEFVKKYIDLLAMHKFNRFHWHLTDDQGWRIQINKYPELTKVGAYRSGTIIGHYPGEGNDNTRYGGFYTQDQVREIVAYATTRHIQVIPEIEMPGHASAAIAAYPYLSCFPEEPTIVPEGMMSEGGKKLQKGGTPKVVQESWGVYDDVFCAGKETTFEFLQGVLEEVLPLFPSKYIHIGGDECPKANWERCPLCQKRIKEEGLADEHELQSYFIHRMEKFINEKGKSIIGWDEILEGGLAPNATVMSWRGEKGGIEAAKQKHDVIMTPNTYLYFDYYQWEDKAAEPLAIGGFLPLDKVYSYNPMPADLTDAEKGYILGAQANLWTEYIGESSKVEYMVLPRMTALSEIDWTPQADRDYADFQQRLAHIAERYTALGLNYSKRGIPDVAEPQAKASGK